MYDYLKTCITVYSVNIHKCISCVRNASCFSKNAPCKDKKRAVTSSQRSFPHMSDGRPAAGWNWLMSNSCNRAGLWCSSIQLTLMVSYCQVRHRMSLSCVVIICEIQFQSLQLGLTMTTEVHDVSVREQVMCQFTPLCEQLACTWNGPELISIMFFHSCWTNEPNDMCESDLRRHGANGWCWCICSHQYVSLTHVTQPLLHWADESHVMKTCLWQHDW